jgi:hypothetical protein
MRHALVLTLATAISACATAPQQKDATLPAAEAAVKPEEITGFWTGDWGNLVLKPVGNLVFGAYTHRDGTLVAKLSDGALVGWWTEEPSRAPTGDAGELEVHFVRDGKALKLLGRYRHGAAGNWHEEWDLHRVDDPSPPELDDRFNDPSLFHHHP